MGCCCAKGPESGSASWNDYPWCGDADNKMYLQSGQYSSTIKTSQSTGATYTHPWGISWDGGNTLLQAADTSVTVSKLLLISGQFSSTILTSVNVLSIGGAFDIAWTGTDTMWAEASPDEKVHLQSGQFTTTLKTSIDVGSHVQSANGCSYILGPSEESFLYCGDKSTSPDLAHSKIIHQNGLFTSTVLGSVTFPDVGFHVVYGVAWKTGANYPWCGYSLPARKLLAQEGTSSTVLTSLEVTSIDSEPHGINTTYHTVG